jgi:hypothetical protein
MKELKNVVIACTGSPPKPGTPVSNAMLDRFTDMDNKLEKIQKSLENYLEKKRQGLTLVHISAQPEPVLVIEATASVHFPAQPEPCS